MASNQEKEQKIDFSVFGKELLQMPQHVHEVYGSLLNNGLYVSQPKYLKEVDVVRYAMQCHFDQVRSVYVQSPQVAYVDLCIGNDLLTDEFKNHFFTGVHSSLSKFLGQVLWCDLSTIMYTSHSRPYLLVCPWHQVNNLLYFCIPNSKLLLHSTRYCIGWYFVSLWEEWKGVSRMERRKELILLYLEKWNSFIFSIVHLIS